ncbi:hypothetical protein [Nonomuraea sp. NPDC050783]|uniref:hypothetical protein n=1 Tax=Nonomuraea sp. NPDC050783 TaxID=3154634 RepID=UPI003466191C
MTTRVFGPLMVGHTGLVLAVMRDGRLAVVKLDGPEHDLPNGIRRWTFHWGDLVQLPGRTRSD